MFVLVGQVLNARGRFGPMMWAPIANNVIAVGVLVVYLVVFGPATDAERTARFTTGQEALLGLGSTLGIVAQLLILLPFLRAAGFRFRPRFDFRGHRARPHPAARRVDGAVRGGQPDRLHGRRPARLRRYGGHGRTGGDGTGYTVYA